MDLDKLKQRREELKQLEEQAKAQLYRIQGSKLEVEGMISDLELVEPEQKKKK